MTYNQTEELANTILNTPFTVPLQSGERVVKLSDYCTFKWDKRAKTRLGCATWMRNKGILSLSLQMIPHISPEEIEDTIRHEAAHLLEFVIWGTSNHGRRWKQLCRITGANPSRTAPIKMPITFYKYIGICPNCQEIRRKFHRQSNTKRICTSCKRKGVVSVLQNRTTKSLINAIESSIKTIKNK